MLPDVRKAKQFLIAAAKVLILAAAFYFIWDQLANNDKLEWTLFLKKLQGWNLPAFALLIFLSFLNRFLEILKWQNLASTIRPITIGEASAQVLGALTAGTFTPNGIGEYGAKALYFEKSQAKNVVFLNLICNGAQMLLSVVFGTAGLIYFNSHFKVATIQTVWVAFGILIALIITLFLLKSRAVKGYSIEKLLRKIGALPARIHQKNFWLAVLRYLTFSHQYYLLFVMFDVDLPYLLLMSAITAVYFLASSLPTFQFLDFAVKGSVAVFFFQLLGINEWIVVFIATLMWLLNVVIPVFIGSYFVLKFKSIW